MTINNSLVAEKSESIPKTAAAGELPYDFSSETVGTDPNGSTSFFINEDPADGDISVQTLGDAQGNHVYGVKTGGIDTVYFRDTIYDSTGYNPMIGAVSFKYYREDTGFSQFFIRATGADALLMEWYGGTIQADGTQTVCSFVIDHWYDVIVYFNFTIGGGWMFDLDGVRYGGDYELPFTDTPADGALYAVWQTAYSGSNGAFRVDDISYFVNETENPPYTFSTETVGQNPHGSFSFSVYEDPADGDISIQTLGDAQGNHVYGVKTGGLDTVTLRDAFSTSVGIYPTEGTISFKYYKEDNGYSQIYVRAVGADVLKMEWYQGTIQADDTYTVCSYLTDVWVDVVIYFNFTANGWMFDLDGVRHGDGYALPFTDTPTGGAIAVIWQTAYSASNAQWRVDDIDYNFTLAPNEPQLDSITSPDNDGSYTIQWNDVSGAEYYKLFRSTSPITSIEFMTPIYSGVSSEYSESSLAEGDYYYMVVAEAGAGQSGFSNEIFVSVNYTEYTPEAPVLYSVTSPDLDGSFNINWSAVPDIDSYALYRSDTNITALGGLTAIYTGTNTAYDESGLIEGDYYYAVVAENSSGVSAISNNVHVTVDFPDSVPAAPVLYSVISPDLDGSFNINWGAVPDIDSYALYRSDTNITALDDLTPIYEGADTNYYEVLPFGGRFYYCVVASNSTGTSELSNQIVVDFPIEEFTNNKWQDIEMGVNMLECTDEDLVLRLSIYITATDSTEMKITYSDSNPAPISILEGSECQNFYQLQVGDESSIQDGSTINFYLPDSDYDASHFSQLTVYKLKGNTWIEVNNTKFFDDKRILVMNADVSAIYAIGFDVIDNEENPEPGLPSIPGFPIELLGIVSITFILFTIKKIHPKLK